MENIKLPDLSRLKDVKKRLKSLPPQESAVDTSNWEDRNVSAPMVDIESKKHTVRHLAFIRQKEMLKDIVLDPVRKTGKSAKKAK